LILLRRWRWARHAARGCTCFRISLDEDVSSQEYLSTIFGPGNVVQIDDVDLLPARLPEVFRSLVR
jgi:nitric oxide reductase activation protein